MRRILLWSLLALSLSANLAVAAVALRRGDLPGVPAEPPLFSKASLDPDQRARIVALREKLLADRAAQAARLAGLRATLADLLTRERPDPSAVDATLAEIEGAQSAFQRRVVAHVLSVREVLRPEQLPAFAGLVERQMRAGTPLDPAAAPGGGDGGRP